MSIKVLVVDDSRFFRARIISLLEDHSGIQVIGTAENGKEAIEKALELEPDVITMDHEMPVMNGICAIQAIMGKRPTPILMLSSLTLEGARITLAALEAGAMDFMPKTYEAISRELNGDVGVLVEKVLTLANGRSRVISGTLGQTSSGVTKIDTNCDEHKAHPRSTDNYSSDLAKRQVSDCEPVLKSGVDLSSSESCLSPGQHRAALDSQVLHSSHVRLTPKNFRPAIVCIGASTGGPVAVQSVLKALPADFPFPILVVQHMPCTFTPAFAQRLNDMCNISVKHAECGDEIKPGRVLVAPGGMQMTVAGSLHRPKVSVHETDGKEAFKPSVDVTYGSVSEIFHESVLAIVLTGMGNDGMAGAKRIKQRSGSFVWAQDEGSCVVYGMPRAVAEEKLVDEVMPLDQIGERLAALQ